MSSIEKFVMNIILITLIIINVLEFIGFLPGEVGFIKAIASMSAVGYVLYRVSLTKVFFGKTNPGLDLSIVLTYFLLIVSKFVEVSFNAILNSTMFDEFFLMIVSNSVMIDTLGIILGNIAILIICIYYAFNGEVYEPSIAHALKLNPISGRLKKFFVSFIILNGFYLIFFNVIMEWLTLIIDAPLVVAAIFFYVFYAHDYSRNMDSESILVNIADSVENLLKDFMGLFHQEGMILIGITGLIVLHLITDFFVFIIPYNLGISHNLYLNAEHAAQHDSIINIFSQDKLIITDIPMQLFLLYSYVMNSIGITFLLLLPGYLWYKKVNDLEIDLPGYMVALFVSSVIFLLGASAYSISSYKPGTDLLGVDILTRSIANSNFKLISLLSLSLLIILILISNEYVKQKLMLFIKIGSLSYLGFYIFNFLKSHFLINAHLISSLLNPEAFSAFATNLNLGLAFAIFSKYFLIIYTIFYLVLTIFLYIGGFFAFISEVS